MLQNPLRRPGFTLIEWIVVFVIDMKNGGQHAPEILGAMTASIVITLGLSWVWKKIYFSKKVSPGPARPQ